MAQGNIAYREQTLDGIWQLKEDGGKWMPASVPGTVYQALLDNRVIEDPYYRENEILYRSVSNKDYIYHCEFVVDKLEDVDAVYLTFDGIDTIADTYLNDKLVLHSENMHRVFCLCVTDNLRVGNNNLEVHLHSPYKQIDVIKERHPHVDMNRYLMLAKMEMRKAPSMFGWDWGPELPDLGLYRAVGISAYRGARIYDLRISQEHHFQEAVLHCKWQAEIYRKEAVAEVSVTDPDGNLVYQTIVPIQQDNEVIVSILNPKLWWCVNYGGQPLYTLRICVKCHGEETQTLEKRIGLRTIQVIQKDDEFGQSFYFAINGVEVFCKGGSYIPEDSLYGRMTFERSKKIIDDCISANFNIIRIWGGGVFPTEEFLNYCDEKGVLIWQDFMFCQIIPIWQGKEKEDIVAEITQQTRRLSCHSCIAILCGNNETEAMADAKLNRIYIEMYQQQFEKDMAQIVHSEAPGIFYWPSSPSTYGGMNDPDNETIGDSHNWKVWHGKEPFVYYRECYPRFMSEFGLQSFPCLKTIESFTIPDDRNIFSPVMEDHQKSANGNEVIMYYISQYFRFPKDYRALIYLSQTIQLEGVRYGVEHWRRNRNKHRCMGAMYWQINDCWPVASWSSIDYFGKWKALQYGARRFFAPVLISAKESETKVEIHISNETLYPVNGRVCWQLRNDEFGVIREGEKISEVDRLSSSCILKLDFTLELRDTEKLRSNYLTYTWIQDGKEQGGGTVLFVPAKYFSFRNPKIRCEKKDGVWKLTSENLAKFVCLETPGNRVLSDNYFDLIPGKPVYIGLEESVNKDDSTMPLIYSLYDSFEKFSK